MSKDNLLAQDMASSPTTPRAHWRQQPIKDRALFHVYDLQCRKATLRGWRRAKLCTQAISFAQDLVSSLPTPRAHWRQQPIKICAATERPHHATVRQQLFNCCDSCDSATVLRQCDSFATVRQLRQYEQMVTANCCRRAGATVATVATACDSCDSATVRQ